MKHKIKNFIILGTTAVFILHLINKFIQAASTVKNLLFKDRGNFFNWRFGNIFYSVKGTGKPLLLIHDLSVCSSSYEWSELIDKLSTDHTVYSIDLLGCGRSDKPAMTYTNFLYVQLITDFIKQVIGQKTDIAVTGLSSSFVIMACYNDADLFHKIIMINPVSTKELCYIPGKKSNIKKFIMEMPIIGTTVYHLTTTYENIEYLFTEKYLYNPFRFNTKYAKIYHEAAHLSESKGRYLQASLSGLYLNVNINHALSEINNSICILGGKRCNDMEEIIFHYQDINPAIEAEMISDTKLLPQLEAPDMLYSQLKVFL